MELGGTDTTSTRLLALARRGRFVICLPCLFFSDNPHCITNSVWIDFDGVQRDSVAYLNGKALGTHLSGYTSFRYDVTGLLHNGKPNVLAVRADCTKPDGWWYDGGGIYRHVWITTANKLHVAPWGVFTNALVTTPTLAAGTFIQSNIHTV
jgi:beta-galactosidase